MILRSLPPDPKTRLDSEMVSLISEADKFLNYLDGASMLLTESHYIHTILTTLEAAISNNIDDEKMTLRDFFNESLSVESETSRSILQYARALALGKKLIKDVSSSSRIIKSIHKELKIQNEKEDSSGEFRKTSTWVGQYKNNVVDARYIPPPQKEIPLLMNDLENYVASDLSYPVIINAALIHGQFEMIHPFESRNGLVGRILFQLHLLWKKKLNSPILQISSQLLKHKNEYFEHIEELEKNNNWDAWIKFFVKIVIAASQDTLELIKKITALENRDYQKILDKEFASTYSLKLFDLLLWQPVITLPFITKSLGFNKQSANLLITKFLNEKILEETTGKQRNRIFVYKDYLNILET